MNSVWPFDFRVFSILLRFVAVTDTSHPLRPWVDLADTTGRDSLLVTG